jgi:hypothetical protein
MFVPNVCATVGRSGLSYALRYDRGEISDKRPKLLDAADAINTVAHFIICFKHEACLDEI